MPEDRSLDEFVGGRAAGDDPADDAADGDDVDAATDDAESTTDDQATEDAESTTGVGSVTPAASTSAWSTGGSACERCGEDVTRRWRDEGAFVCGSCKDW